MSSSSLFAPSPPLAVGSKLFEDFGFGLTTPSIVLETSSSQINLPSEDFFISEPTYSSLLSHSRQQQQQQQQQQNQQQGQFKYSGAESLVTPPPQSRNGSLDATAAFHSSRTPGFALTLNSISGPPSPALSVRSEISNGTTFSNHSDAHSRSFSAPTPGDYVDPEVAALTNAFNIDGFGDRNDNVSFAEDEMGMGEMDFSLGTELEDMLKIHPELLTLNIDDLVAGIGLTESPTQSSPTDSLPTPSSGSVPGLASVSLGSTSTASTGGSSISSTSSVIHTLSNVHVAMLSSKTVPILAKPPASNNLVAPKPIMSAASNPIPQGYFNLSNFASSAPGPKPNPAIPQQIITATSAMLTNAPPHPHLLASGNFPPPSPAKVSPGSATATANMLNGKTQIRPIVRPSPPNTKLFHCNLCNMSFRRSHDLKRHTRSLHTKVKPYVCVKCNKSFSRLDALKRHVARKSSPCFVDFANGEVLVVPPFED
ncbi:hypothetical protein HDU97_004281 [Phlyctochytrium planicorne]|nr:hypothetical protein HDU97_004281 [Phlyctochytrium planicorne]